MFHYIDSTHLLKPYAYSLPGELPAGAILPDNAVLSPPNFDRMKGKEWGVLNASGDGWNYTEDHRKRTDERGREVEGSGTPYWLPGDTWQTPARYMTDIGPLPSGAVLVQPEKALAELKEDKLQELRQAFDREEAEGYAVSSLGFKADATRKSKADIDGLIQAMDAMGMPDVAFRDYDNQTHTLTLAQMKTLQLEVIQKGLWNYQTKWTLEGAVNAATTPAEVEAIVWPTDI